MTQNLSHNLIIEMFLSQNFKKLKTLGHVINIFGKPWTNGTLWR